MASRINRIIGMVKEAFFPARCLNCDTICPWPVSSSDPSIMAGHLCPRCEGQLVSIGSPMCIRCGRPFVTDEGVDHLCGDCQNSAFAFEGARAAGIYVDTLKTLIHHYKYRGCEPLALPLGQMLWMAFWEYWTLADVDTIVPVPLHPRRMRKRGFNQAGLLLRSWPRLALEHGVELNRRQISNRTLVRLRHTLPQTGLNRKARKKNMRGAFELGSTTVKGLRVLLVDDVFTTGATVNACAQILIRAGAKSVRVLTLARAA